MEEMTTGLCPKCGHTLQIPAELERFSCMYCGERLTKRQLLTQPEEASCSEEDCAVSFDHAVSRLGWCVQNFRGYQKKILRDAFFEAFETYETGCAPVIQELNSGVRPSGRQSCLTGPPRPCWMSWRQAGRGKTIWRTKRSFWRSSLCRWCASCSCRSARNLCRCCRKMGRTVSQIPVLSGRLRVHFRRLPQEVPRTVLHHDRRLSGAR